MNEKEKRYYNVLHFRITTGLKQSIPSNRNINPRLQGQLNINYIAVIIQCTIMVKHSHSCWRSQA